MGKSERGRKERSKGERPRPSRGPRGKPREPVAEIAGLYRKEELGVWGGREGKPPGWRGLG